MMLSFEMLGDNFEDIINLIIHPRNQKFYEDPTNLQKGYPSINLNVHNVCKIKYNMIIQKYMFTPFGSCFEGQTRDECISQCIVDRVINT